MSPVSPRGLPWPRLRRMLAISLPYWRSLATALLLVFLAVAATLALPMGMKLLLDQALSGGDSGVLNRLALILLGVFLLRSVLAFVGQYKLRFTGEKIVAGLRQSVYEKLHQLDLQFHSKQRIGDLTSRLTNDTATIRALVTDVLVSTSLQVFQLTGAIVLMAILNWRLTLLVVVFAPLATVVSRLFSPVLERIARSVQDRLANSAAVAQEVLSAMPLVQSFGRSRYETGRFRTTLDGLVESSQEAARVGALFSSLMNLLFAISSVAIFWFGGREVLASRLTAGDLVAFMFYSQAVSEGVGALAQHLATLSATAGASERVFEILDTETKVAEVVNPVVLSNIRGDIRFEGVSFAYEPDRPVLQDFSLTLEPGKTVALVGPSGAGKSTILQLLVRLYDPTRGRVLIDGHDLRTVALESLRSQVAIVSQEVYIFGTTIRENIRYGRLDATDEEVERAAKTANAHDFIVQLPNGYETVLGERGIGLSGGQRQRLSIARALLKDARILILDEATSSVDNTSETAIHEAIDLLGSGRTTVRVTHRLASLRNVDTIVTLNQGRIVERGSQAELMASEGLFRQLVEGRSDISGGELPVPEPIETRIEDLMRENAN